MPEKMVLEGQLRVDTGYYPIDNVEIGGKSLSGLLNEWEPNTTYSHFVHVFPGTYRITVERLPDAPCCDDADACTCDPCACSCSG